MTYELPFSHDRFEKTTRNVQDHWYGVRTGHSDQVLTG